MSFSRGALPLTWLPGPESPPGAAHFGTILPRSIRLPPPLPSHKRGGRRCLSPPPPSGKETEEGGTRAKPARPAARSGIRCVELCLGSAGRASFTRSEANPGPTAGAQPAPRLPGRGTFYIDARQFHAPGREPESQTLSPGKSAGRDLYLLQPPPPPNHQCLGTQQRRRRRLVLQVHAPRQVANALGALPWEQGPSKTSEGLIVWRPQLSAG